MCCSISSPAAIGEEANGGADATADVSFLEYLGLLVEADKEGAWLDPLDLDNEVLVEDDAGAAAPEQPLATGESS